jgi:ribonuclease P protein component
VRWFASLRRAGEFARVRRRGRRAALATIAAYGVAHEAGGLRVGVTVAKSVGCAVVRNRVRRRIQGALDALVPAAGVAPVAADLVFVARPEAAAASYSALASDVAAALATLARRSE